MTDHADGGWPPPHDYVDSDWLHQVSETSMRRISASPFDLRSHRHHCRSDHVHVTIPLELALDLAPAPALDLVKVTIGSGHQAQADQLIRLPLWTLVDSGSEAEQGQN